MNHKNDIGFVVTELINDNNTDNILNCIKQYINNNPFDQIVIFNSFCDKIDTKNIPILHLSHAQFFSGKLVLFDLIGILLSKSFPNVTKKYFYATDIPWLSSPHTPYSEWVGLYSDPNLHLISSNKELYDIYQLMWKKPVGISEDFSYETIKNIL
jgi:hypothetical protein